MHVVSIMAGRVPPLRQLIGRLVRSSAQSRKLVYSGAHPEKSTCVPYLHTLDASVISSISCRVRSTQLGRLLFCAQAASKASTPVHPSGPPDRFSPVIYLPLITAWPSAISSKQPSMQIVSADLPTRSRPSSHVSPSASPIFSIMIFSPQPTLILKKMVR